MSADPLWVNGSLGGTIDPRDRGLTLGDGVFDTMVAFGHVPFAAERHLERLVAHAAAIGIAVDRTVIRSGWDAVCAAAGHEHVILRTTVTRGQAGRRLWPESACDPTIIVAASQWTPDLVGKPVKLVTSKIARNETSPLSRLKSLNYLDNVLAARQAAASNADDALFLNGAGNVASTTIANIFGLSGRRLVTPPISDGAMPGIVRGLILGLAPELGFETAESSLTLDTVLSADAMFLTNSVRLISPVSSLDGRAFGHNHERVLVLMAACAERIGRECGYSLSA